MACGTASQQHQLLQHQLCQASVLASDAKGMSVCACLLLLLPLPSKPGHPLLVTAFSLCQLFGIPSLQPSFAGLPAAADKRGAIIQAK